MAITGEQGISGPIDPEDTVNEFLSIARLVSEPDLARLYTYVLQHGPVEIRRSRPTSASLCGLLS